MLCQPAALAHPQSELHAARLDLERNVAPVERATTRYVSFYPLVANRRAAARDVLSFVLNSVSRATVLIRPEVVPGSEGSLLRVSLARYGLPAEEWERLASRDPYWHLRTEVLDPTASVGGKRATRAVFTDGGWLDLDEARTLRELSHSSGALLRGDFFLRQATTTLDGGAYYRLAGIAQTEAEFLRTIGIDSAVVDRLQADEGANLLYSLVTFKLRRIVRRAGPLGGVWQTYDVNASTAERDPFRNPFAFTYDAGEYIVAKKNGLHLFALFDANGQRQDTVPDVIAKDASEPRGPGIVVPMISCVRCHVEDGLRPFVNDQQRLLSSHVALVSDDPRVVERLAAFYDTNLGKRLLRDREDYAAAVGACTEGRTPAEIAALLAEFIAEYADRPVTIEQAARELGLSVEQLQRALRVSHDPALLALVAGLAIQRQQWEASFAEAALLAAPLVSSSQPKE